MNQNYCKLSLFTIKLFYYCRVLKECGKFATGKHRLHQESRKLMEVGKLPLRREDLKLIPSTYYDYKSSTNRLMGIISKNLKRTVRMKHFFAYGLVELIEPLPDIAEWLSEVESLGRR